MRPWKPFALTIGTGLLLALMALAPSGLSGTAADPEVTDEDDDVSGPGGSPACQPGACQGAPGFADILTGWVMLEEDNVVFRMDSANNENAYGESEYLFHFSVGGATYFAGLDAGQSTTVGGDGHKDPAGVATEAGWVDTIITIVVPLAAIGGPGDVITELYTTSAVHAGGSGTFTDRGPSEGFGRDYVIPGTKASVAAVNLTVTEGPLEHTFEGNGMDALFNITWVAPSNVSLEIAATGEGIVNITVTDPTGRVKFSCFCNVTEATASASGELRERADVTADAGNWTIIMEYIGFNGTASLDMWETTTGDGEDTDDDLDRFRENDGGNETAAEGSADGSDASSGADGGDSPLPLWVGVLALAAAVALRRRR